MRFGILIVFIALIVVLFIYTGKGRRDNPVSQGITDLDKVKTTTSELDMNSISTAIAAYFDNHNEYPETLDMLVPSYLPSANSILDSWGNPFHLEKDNQQNLFLISAGPDRVFATADDIKRRL
jgi:hypothetical protein